MIEVRDRYGEVVQPLRDYVVARLESTLGHLALAVERIMVLLGPVRARGEHTIERCRVAARLKDGRRVLIEEAGADFYGLIDRAAERLAAEVGFDAGPERTGEARTSRTVA